MADKKKSEEKPEAKAEAQVEAQAEERSVLAKLNPVTNLGGHAFANGRSVLVGETVRLTPSEYDALSKEREGRHQILVKA